MWGTQYYNLRMNKENLLISFLQAWGILLVVIGHSFYNSPDNAACVWIYTFHMPLFIFISGYLLRYSSDMKKVNLSEMPLYGIVMSLFLGCIYIKYNWRFLHHLFGASYAIYLFSWFPQVLSQQVFLNVIHVPSSVGTLLAIFTGIYIPLFIYKWIIKNKGNKIGYVVAVLTGQ